MWFRLKSINRSIPILISIFILFSSLNARVIRVPGDAASIQVGVDAAERTDTVLVARGVYRESINFNGMGILVGSNFIFSSNRADIEQTVIDGGQSGRVVTFAGNENNSSRLIGFTIRNGQVHLGAGVYCRHADPTLEHLVIEDNHALEDGGGIYCIDRADPVLRNIIIQNNTADGQGGGMYCREGCDPSLFDVDIVGNTASSGGGMYLHTECDAELTDVLVAGNSAGAIGGGIACVTECDIRMLRVAIIHNSAERLYGGGLHIGASNPDLDHVTISENHTDDGRGGGIHLTGTCDMTIRNSIVWENQPTEVHYFGNPEHPGSITVNYCDINGGRDGFTVGGSNSLIYRDGNINENPLFADAGNRDMHLRIGSPCIDSGDPDSPNDPDNTRADMGAYYFDQSGDWVSHGSRNGSAPLTGLNVFPNPFNAFTVLSYRVNAPGNVGLKLYNQAGRHVSTLADYYQQPGVYEIRFNAGELPSGIYFARLEAGQLVSSVKLYHIR